MDETDDVVSKLTEALLAGRKIEAIKVCREAMGFGLKEAKEYVEKIEDELRQKNPDVFPEKKGCVGMVAFGLISTATRNVVRSRSYGLRIMVRSI